MTTRGNLSKVLFLLAGAILIFGFLLLAPGWLKIGSIAVALYMWAVLK